MSHLVYITLYGETDGVILSRLDCIGQFVGGLEKPSRAGVSILYMRGI
jgi:hypothetical protein